MTNSCLVCGYRLSGEEQCPDRDYVRFEVLTAVNEECCYFEM
jgi:hypothetical protein